MEFRCFLCNHELVIDDNWFGSDIGLVSEDKELTDDDFIVTIMHCQHCGTSYEIAECPVSEQSNYPFYNDSKKV